MSEIRQRVSVIIAAFDAEPFLHRAVASALDQDVDGVEIIIVDDKSSDGTLQEARRLASVQTNVRVEALPKNGGPALARNAAIPIARGEWLAVLDADDALEPDHLSTLLAIADAESSDVVLSNFVYYDPLQNVAGRSGIPLDCPAQRVDIDTYLQHSRATRGHADWGLLKPLFRTSFLKERGITYPSECRHGEDFLMMIEVILGGAKVVTSPKPTYKYSSRESGWSRTRIDYDSIVEQTQILKSDPRLRGDRDLMAALRDRLKAARRLSARHKVQQWRGARNWSDLAHGFASEHEVRRECARLLYRSVIPRRS